MMKGKCKLIDSDSDDNTFLTSCQPVLRITYELIVGCFLVWSYSLKRPFVGNVSIYYLKIVGKIEKRAKFTTSCAEYFLLLHKLEEGIFPCTYNWIKWNTVGVIWNICGFHYPVAILHPDHSACYMHCDCYKHVSALLVPAVFFDLRTMW